MSKHPLTLIATLVACSFGMAKTGSQPSQSAAAARDTLHVLFIGNSYTYFHNTPRIVETIADSLVGPVVRTKLVAHGGWTLDDHWKDTATQAALHERKWDWIVINEQSTFGDTYLVDGKTRIHSADLLAGDVQRLAGESRKIGARLAIIGHWSRRVAPARDDSALRFAFDSVSRSVGAALIPVGAAWHSPEFADQKIDLYFVDGSHPSPAGSYLLANLVYETVTGRSAVGAPAAIRGPMVEEDDGIVHPDSLVPLVDLPVSSAGAIQRVAWNVYSRAKRAGGYLPASRPAPIALPSLPTNREHITRELLVGTWRGTTTLYPAAKPPELELRIERAGDSLSGTLHRVIGAGPESASDVQVSIAIADDVVTMIDPKGPNGGTVRYRGVLSERKLRGVAEFVIPAPRVYGVGSWEMAREQ